MRMLPLTDLIPDTVEVYGALDFDMDSMRERIFGSVLHGFLDTVREGKPDAPITVISPIYCPPAEHDPGPTPLAEHGKFVAIPGHAEMPGQGSTRPIR